MKKTTTYILTVIVCVLLLGCNDNDYISVEDLTLQKIEELEDKLDSLNDSYDEKSQEYDELCTKLLAKQTELDTANNELQNIKNNLVTYNERKAELDSIEKSIYGYTNGEANAYMDELVTSITTKEAELATLNNSLLELTSSITEKTEQINTLNSEIDKLKSKKVEYESTFTLGAGTYVVGEDIPSGKYDISVVSWCGYISDDLWVELATEDSRYAGDYPSEYKGARLKDGDSFEIKGYSGGVFKVKFSKVLANIIPDDVPEELRAYYTGITYEQLARTPDAYKGQKLTFTGKVLQVLEGVSKNYLRLAIDGNSDETIYVTYNKSDMSERILENDTLTIYGTSSGLTSYTSVMDTTITIPSMSAVKIIIK